jgi:hypothetical protein
MIKVMKTAYFSRSYQQFVVVHHASKYKSLYIFLTDIQLPDKWIIVFVKHKYISLVLQPSL